MTFAELVTQISIKFEDVQLVRFHTHTVQLYKDMANEGQMYLARFLSSDSLQRICSKIGINPIDYIKKLVTVVSSSFTITGNIVTLPDFLSLLWYKVNDYPVRVYPDKKILFQQKYNPFMEGDSDFYIAHQTGSYMMLFPDYNAGDTNEIGYVKEPTKMVNDADVPEIDLALHDLIVNCAVGKLYNFDRAGELSLAFAKQLERDIYLTIGAGALGKEK